MYTVVGTTRSDLRPWVLANKVKGVLKLLLCIRDTENTKK
jgi:hypothetical protein